MAIRLPLFTACMLIGASLIAEESVTPEPPLLPQPRNIPLVPGVGEERALSEDEQLLQRLRLAIEERDQQINALLDRKTGDLPPSGSIDIPETADDRAARDQAWEKLAAALEQIAQEQHQTRDILDTPAAWSDDLEVQRLTARNQLSMARSYKALLEDEDEPGLGDMRRAYDLLRSIAIEHLAEHDRPQRAYLLFWFASELARRTQGDERTAFFEAAQTAHRRLVSDWPGSSSLVISAQTLMDQLQRALQQEAAL